MKRQISVNTLVLIFFIIFTVTVKAALYSYPSKKTMFETVEYNYITSNYIQASMAEIKNTINNNAKRPYVYYIGRSSCSDCRFVLKNINEIFRFNKKNDIVTYYVPLTEKISTTELQILDHLNITSIPVIIIVYHNQTFQFDYNNIINSNFIKQYSKLLEEVL